jgi:hypothetical protein
MALVRASGKREQSTGSPIDYGSKRRAELEREAAAEGFNGPALDSFTQGRTAE